MNDSSRSSWSGRGARAAMAALLVAGLCVAAGCGRQPTLPPEAAAVAARLATDTLHLSLPMDPGQLNPILPLDEYGRLVVNLIHAAPLRRIASGGFAPDLWQSHEITVDDQGRLVVSGVWRGGLSWHDGTVFSPADLVFTIDCMRQPANLSPYRELAEKVATVSTDATGRCTVVFSTNDVACLEVLAAGVLPAHLIGAQPLADAQYRFASGTIMAVTATSETAPGVASTVVTASGTLLRYHEAPIGLGPYAMALPRDRYCMVLRAHGPGARLAADGTLGPRFKEILVEYHFDPEGMVHGLRSGKTDVAWLPSELARGFSELKVQNVRLVRRPNPSYWLLGVNTKCAPFAQVEVRRLLAAVIDREALARLIPYAGTPAARPWPAAGSASAAAVTPTMAPEAVKAKLQALGAVDSNGDGVLELGGRPLELPILVNDDNLLRKQMAESLTSRCNAAGFKASVTAVPWSDLVQQRLLPGSYTAFLMAFAVPANGDWRALWGSRGMATGSLNFTGVSDPQLDALLAQLARWPVPSDRAALVEQAVARILEAAPGAFLFIPDDVMAVRDNVQGVVVDMPLWDLDLGTWAKTAP